MWRSAADEKVIRFGTMKQLGLTGSSAIELATVVIGTTELSSL
jgi:hypothetical protein